MAINTSIDKEESNKFLIINTGLTLEDDSDESDEEELTQELTKEPEWDFQDLKLIYAALLFC